MFISAGFGLALTFTPSIVMIGEYFDEHLTVANGLAYSGGSIGQICMPLITSALINSYGWRGAILILSAIWCHLLVSGALIRHKLTNKPVTEAKDTANNTEYENPAFERTEPDTEMHTLPTNEPESAKNGQIATKGIADENTAHTYTELQPEIAETGEKDSIATNSVVYERNIAHAHTEKDPELPMSESRE